MSRTTQLVGKAFPLLAAALLLAAPWALANDSSLDGSAATGPDPADPTREPPTLVISFHDPIDHHCMGITSDGSYYYTINGGNASWGEIRTYDLSGNPLQTVSCAIDARSIHFNPDDGKFYAKTYTRDWVEVNPETGEFSTVFPVMFHDSQSSGALTPDGAYILEHLDGTVYWYDAGTGSLIDTMSGFFFGSFPSSSAMTTDGNRIFTWDGTMTYVYDMAGTQLENWEIPSGHYGFSLSFANGLLFTSNDDTDMWYGYDVGGVTPAESGTWGSIKSLYR